MNKFDVLLNWKRACLHNVLLVDVGPGDDNQVALSVELGGQETRLLGGAVFADWYRNDIGKVGLPAVAPVVDPGGAQFRLCPGPGGDYPRPVGTVQRRVM